MTQHLPNPIEVHDLCDMNGQLYHITNLCPRTDILMGRCGFSIELFEAWKNAVRKSKLTQASINTVIKNMHRLWLDGCGYNQIFDPDQTPLDVWRKKNLGEKQKYGPKSRPLYGEDSIRVQWGEWGPEHITVPGDACGLDIDNSDRKRVTLVPHNIDNLNQIVLILTIFTRIADLLVNQ